MSNRLAINCFTLGDWRTNCYVLHPGSTPSGKCWIIDAGFSPEPLINYVRQKGLVPEMVLLTHAHIDHIAGLHAIRAAWPRIPILINSSEHNFLADPALNLSIALDEPFEGPDPTGFLEPGTTLRLDGVAFQVRHTPGHSPGGVTLYAPDEKLAFVGDTLFAGSVGRTDFPTSDPSALKHSIQSQLLSMPDPTLILPGHGPSSTIGQERRTNPFL